MSSLDVILNQYTLNNGSFIYSLQIVQGVHFPSVYRAKEKTMFLKKDSQRINSEQSFTPRDLARYIEYLIIHSRSRERRATSTTNYSWLTFKPSLHNEATIQSLLNPLQPVLNKLTPESCASIFMKIEKYVTEDTTVDDIMKTLTKLLEEQLNSQMIEQNINDTKRRRKNSKIHPCVYCDTKLFTIFY